VRMSKIVRTQSGFLYPFILIFGLYIVMHGHLTPGGGFQGGAIIATGVALIAVSYEFESVRKWIAPTRLTLLEGVGLLAFIITALAGFGTSFFWNWLANSGSIFGSRVPPGINPGDLNTGGVLPLMNLAVGMEVVGGLGAIIIYMLDYVKRGEEGAA
jgi:energy-converting hydrogenase B subunit I